jgi:serine protease DegS
MQREHNTDMSKLLRFLSWPVICGILTAIIILEYFPHSIDKLIHPQQNFSLPYSKPIYSYAQAVQQAAPAVVNIYTSKTVKQKIPNSYSDPFLRYFFNRSNVKPQQQTQRNLGSGVIMSPKGYLLTNLHVIDGADEILVLTHDGREALAQVIGTDPESDLAVLKIDLDKLNAIPVADPAEAMVGDVVLAIGNPYGFGQSVSQGIISATGRYGLKLTTYENFIQTDAAINRGNSGGALVDAHGRLLGINTAIFTTTGGYQGIGLATPSDLAIRIMSDLIQYGKVIRGWMGLEARQISRSMASQHGADFHNAVVVTKVHINGPAEQAGLRPGDIITHINGQPVGDGNAAMNFVASTRPGETIGITTIKNGQLKEIKAVLGNRPN